MVFCGFVAVSGYYILTLIQNIERFDLFSCLFASFPDFCVSFEVVRQHKHTRIHIPTLTGCHSNPRSALDGAIGFDFPLHEIK